LIVFQSTIKENFRGEEGKGGREWGAMGSSMKKTVHDTKFENRGGQRKSIEQQVAPWKKTHEGGKKTSNSKPGGGES